MKELHEKDYFAYVCETGCGHTTITDKFFKTKRVHCAVCGIKTEMRYVGEVPVGPVKSKIVIAGLTEPLFPQQSKDAVNHALNNGAPKLEKDFDKLFDDLNQLKHPKK